MKMKRIFEELGIPETYLQETTRQNRFIALVHKLWLKSLIKHLKLSDFIEKSCQEIWPSEEETPSSWIRVFISVLKKKDCKVLPLPKTRTLKEEDSFLFPQFMQYIFQTNYINLWRDTYKKYCDVKPTGEIKVNLVEYNSVLRESIVRVYGCSVINVCDPELTINSSEHYVRHLNVFPTACAIETKSAIFLVHYPYLQHNLSDCVTFSPAILEKSQTKSLFIIYQLLNVLKSLHERSLTLGDVQLNDFYITEDMWIYVFPQIDSNFHFVDNLKFTTRCQRSIQECLKEGHIVNNDLRCDNCGLQIYDKVQVTDETLEQLCLLWIGGQISNFTYILHLNKFSGRVWGDPNCHYVFPWVTDFSSRCGKNWRDLKKSKYRLNKGDHQLDLTHDNCQSQVPHHVSDVLSSITYYVYMARRTPTSILCKNVRTIWVPAEYPSSIQRIQEWTPDECIPEFYSDPSVFRSIHDDLDDLAVPPWASGPEDFIEKHREALESVYVSERIHHWIDLTFGYKLSGSASVKARNVCLNLVDDHEYLTKSGLVQLFSSPHPPRTTDSPYWAKTPPKVFVTKYTKHRSRGRSNSSFIQETNKVDDDNIPNHVQTTTGLSKLYSSSRSSLHEEQITKPTRSQSSQRNESNNLISPRVKFNETPDPNGEVVCLPKDYRPDTALEALEKKYTFFSKTFPSVSTWNARSESKKETEACDDDSQSLFLEEGRQGHLDTRGRHLNSKKVQDESFGEPLVRNYAEIISSRRIRELKVLGCIIVEIFMAKQMRVLGTSSTLEKRLENCLGILKTTPLPPCVSYIVNLLLQPKNYTYPAITDIGLPPPSAHLLLEPLLHCIIPFSKHFSQLYRIFYNLKLFKNVAAELDVLYYFECNGQMCSEYEPLEKTKILISQNIAECQVKTSIKNLEVLFDELNINTDFEVISILLPHIKELMGDAPTSVLAAWYLFEPLSSVLGPRKSSRYLLEPLLKLYENDPNDVNLPYMGKIAKLYHHSFLLCLMVRLGLKCFLENFVVPLVESVGGYKDCELVEFVLHDHSEKNSRKTSHLKTIDSEQMDVSGSDDSTSSDKQELPTEKAAKDEEIFEFEEEKNNEDQMKFLLEHLQLNVSSELPSNSSNVEEGLDANLTDDLNNSEEVNPQVAEGVDSHAFLKSPTIPIPSSYHNNLTNISCEIGSKSDEAHSSNSKFESQKAVPRPKHKISDMSSESLIWLAHRLGPLLTARYLSRNLLKMLALCYMGRDNLVGHKSEDMVEYIEVSIGSGCVVGDIAAVKVLGCLTSISGLYGEQIIIIQYIPHMTELILLCKKRITPNLEGGLISCLALLKQIIPYLSDMMLMDQLQDVLLKNIINPVVKILGSTKHVFPCGGCARNILARKYLDAIYILSIRIGTDMTKKYLMAPALQRFFSIFDSLEVIYPELAKEVELPDQSSSSERYTLVQRSPVRLKELRSSLPGISHEDESVVNRALEELKDVFTPELAHAAYLPFVKLLGSGAMEISLTNHDRIRSLCQEYEESVKASNPNSVPRFTLSDFARNPTAKSSGNIGSNVAVVGNRIDVQPEFIDSVNVDLLSLVSDRTENGARHLRGNWLAYWENEIGRSDANNLLNFKQIKLQTFIGHSQSVKCLYALDNENSFLSGSRDKTIKLWSLRSQGDGFASSNCQWTYSGHKKSILSITFVESVRLVASCDSVVHVWDPFMGVNLANLESSKFAPVNALKSAPAPSTLVFASTTDGTLKILDARLLHYVQELKTSVNPFGLIRCLAVAPSGLWVAAGQSSGNITVLDTRTGLILSNWRAHESEVLQLVAHNDDTVISTSLDQITSVWNISDGKFKFFMKGTTEPVHCLSIHNNELISGTTANRIGVHASIAPDAVFSNNKLRSDTFKGLLTSMDYLPLNKLLLLGADTGNINLLC